CSTEVWGPRRHHRGSAHVLFMTQHAAQKTLCAAGQFTAAFEFMVCPALDRPITIPLQFDLEHRFPGIDITARTHLESAPTPLAMSTEQRQILGVEIHRLVGTHAPVIDLQDPWRARDVVHKFGELFGRQQVLIIGTRLQGRYLRHTGQRDRLKCRGGTGHHGARTRCTRRRPPRRRRRDGSARLVPRRSSHRRCPMFHRRGHDTRVSERLPARSSTGLPARVTSLPVARILGWSSSRATRNRTSTTVVSRTMSKSITTMCKTRAFSSFDNATRNWASSGYAASKVTVWRCVVDANLG